MPTADQMIDRYIQALGGTDAIERITTRKEKGTTTVGRKSIGIEVFDEDPNKQVLVRHLPAGDSIVVFNGHEGWSSMPGSSSAICTEPNWMQRRWMQTCISPYTSSKCLLSFESSIRKKLTTTKRTLSQALGKGSRR